MNDESANGAGDQALGGESDAQQDIEPESQPEEKTEGVDEGRNVGEDLPTQNDEALAGLVNLIVVLADNKYYLGRHLAEWTVGAPVIEDSVACAALAQQHIGQARVLYPLLGELPSPVPAGAPEQETARTSRYNVSLLDEPFPTWPHTVAALVLVDGALTVLVHALEDSSWDKLAERAHRMMEEEHYQREFAEGRVRELVRFTDGRKLLQEQIDAVFQEMLCWFGPRDEAGVEALRSEGLLTQGNEQMRRAYLERVGPVLQDAGIELPARPTDEGWEYDELPWDRWNSLRRRFEAASS